MKTATAVLFMIVVGILCFLVGYSVAPAGIPGEQAVAPTEGAPGYGGAAAPGYGGGAPEAAPGYGAPATGGYGAPAAPGYGK